MNQIRAVITGDIINSRNEEVSQWISSLKTTLSKFGTSPQNWTTYRGDSFQLEVDAENALYAVILIKMSIKKYKTLDVRMAIGLGEVSYRSESISDSNGPVFIRSGECFETLKKKTLAIRTGWEYFDEMMNLYFDLALLTMDSWKPNSLEVLQFAMENPTIKQAEISRLMKKSQSWISQSLNNSGYDEISRLEKMFRKLVIKKISEV